MKRPTWQIRIVPVCWALPRRKRGLRPLHEGPIHFVMPSVEATMHIGRSARTGETPERP